MAKTVIISSLQPQTNYTSYLVLALAKTGEDIIAYGEKDDRNLALQSQANVKLVWGKGLIAFWQITKELAKDKPDIVHLQHEINMYGGLVSACLLPIFAVFIKLQGYKLITTIHAVVPSRNITLSFLHMFKSEQAPQILVPFLKLFFAYTYTVLGIASDKIIVHTNLLKSWLVSYPVAPTKVQVVPHGVPYLEYSTKVYTDSNRYAEIDYKYFLYFGYLVRRKGLENVVKGFADFVKATPDSNFKLILAGGVITGQEFAVEELKKLIADLAITDKVIITGFVNNTELATLFNRAYVILLPAVLSIAASGPLSQAFAYKKCVLASKLDNLIEEIEDNVDGLLIENTEWGQGIQHAYKNPELVHTIETAVAKKAASRDWLIIAKLHVQIYKSLLG